VKGGATRLESVQNGLVCVPKNTAVIAVHDGARPLVTGEIISRTVRLATQHNAAAAAVKVTSTVKMAEHGVVTSTPEREKLREIQTPQAFGAELLKAAVKNATDRALQVTGRLHGGGGARRHRMAHRGLL
jgi:2-C-methyl-D-erythritol 4-phosphate cytidylyltransferase